MEGDVGGLTTGAGATELGPNKRAVTYSGRRPEEAELEVSMGSMEQTTFMRTEEGRNGTQEIKVWVPQLKQLMDRDLKSLQCILDLTDWWVLHMTSTPGTTQRPTEWATQGRTRGSGFKVTSIVLVRGIPTAPQLETIRRFVANSLLVELKTIQVGVTDPGTLNRDHMRISVTIQVRGIHPARMMVRELRQWMSISLEGVLLDSVLWEPGIRSPTPDIPKMMAILGGMQEENPLSEDRDSSSRVEAFLKQIRTVFEEHKNSRSSTGTVKGGVNFEFGSNREKRRENHGPTDS